METTDVVNTVSPMELITFLIAVVSFCFSIFNFVENRIAHARNLEVHVKYALKESRIALFVIEFVNKSWLGISITSGSFNDNGTKHNFGEISTQVFTYSDPVKSGKVGERTKRFPLKIEPLSAVQVLMESDNWNPELPTCCNLRLGTSRGPIRANNVSLPADLADWKLLLKCIK